MIDQIVRTSGRCLNTALRVASNRSLPNGAIFSPQNWIKSKQSLNNINAGIEQYIDMLPIIIRLTLIFKKTIVFLKR